ncbi:hypothetical protein ACUODJ_45970, partial [Escherichia sp. HC-CC]
QLVVSVPSGNFGDLTAGLLGYAAVDDETTQQTMRELKELGYTSEPHAAVAYRALRDQLNPGEYGLFLGTAHPAKFKESVESILGETLDLPKELAERAEEQAIFAWIQLVTQRTIRYG